MQLLGFTMVYPSHLLPSAPEHDRLYEQHVALIELMHGLFRAPVEYPQRILDIGCGTGAVTCALGQKFPDAQVVGLDPSPVPGINNKTKNVSFTEGRMPQILSSVSSVDGTNFERASYDLVFHRLLVGGMTHWQEFLRAVTSLLKPGGFV